MAFEEGGSRIDDVSFSSTLLYYLALPLLLYYLANPISVR